MPVLYLKDFCSTEVGICALKVVGGQSITTLESLIFTKNTAFLTKLI